MWRSRECSSTCSPSNLSSFFQKTWTLSIHHIRWVSVVSTKNPLISSRSKSLHLISGLIWWNTGDRNTVGYRWILARNFIKRQGLISSLISQCSHRLFRQLENQCGMWPCKTVLWWCWPEAAAIIEAVPRYEVLCWPATFEPFECQVTGLMKICLNGSSNKKKGSHVTPICIYTICRISTWNWYELMISELHRQESCWLF